MKYTDIDILEVVEGRLAGVQQRKESLMKFVNTLEMEEQQLLSLQKTYKENRPLYDLIQDEPTITPQDIESKYTKVVPESKEGRARDAALIVLQQYGGLTPVEIYGHAKELVEDIEYAAVQNATYRMSQKGILTRGKDGKYYINHAYRK